MTSAGALAKGAIALAMVAAAAAYYKEAMKYGKQAIDKVRMTSVSNDLVEYDKALSFFWETQGALPQDVPAYIRKQIHSYTGRDVTQDTWGTPYLVKPLPKGYSIRSAGPDKTLDTKDDLFVERVGDAVTTHFSWSEKPEDIAKALQDATLKHADNLKKIAKKAQGGGSKP
jgi:alpha-L-fucosidase